MSTYAVSPGALVDADRRVPAVEARRDDRGQPMDEALTRDDLRRHPAERDLRQADRRRNPLPSIVTARLPRPRAGWTAEMRDGGTLVMRRWSLDVQERSDSWNDEQARSGPSVTKLDETSGLVELHVPVEVIAPAVRGVLEADGNPDRRRLLGTFGHAYQVHAGFGRRAPAFPAGCS